MGSILSVESPPAFRIRRGTNADIDTLTAIHLRSFDSQSHLVVRLGKNYVKAMYKFFLPIHMYLSPRTARNALD